MKTGLGKGLGALLDTESTYENGIIEMRINDIEPNSNQPRKRFDDEKLKQLADSIIQHGVIQPIIVKKAGESYKIVAGERRWRAARLAGLNKIPAIVKDMSDKKLMEVALIENLQREDLNPIEEAEAYERLIDEYEMTQEEVAKTVGRSRSAIANSTRLLGLDDIVKGYVSSGMLSSGHARAILPISNVQKRILAAKEIMDSELNVRDTEKLVKKMLTKKSKTKNKAKDCDILAIEEKLKEIFGTKVRLQAGNKRGKIIIEYYSNEELDRLLELTERLKKSKKR